MSKMSISEQITYSTVLIRSTLSDGSISIGSCGSKWMVHHRNTPDTVGRKMKLLHQEE